MLKTANKTTLGTVLNTFLNPISSDTLPAPKWLSPFGAGAMNKERNRILLHLLAIGATYGTGAFAARHIGRIFADKDQEKYKGELEDYLTAQNIYYTPDPVTHGDLREENKVRKLGLTSLTNPLQKAAGFEHGRYLR